MAKRLKTVVEVLASKLAAKLAVWKGVVDFKIDEQFQKVHLLRKLEVTKRTWRKIKNAVANVLRHNPGWSPAFD